MCKCHSYNADTGTVQEVVLNPNEYFDWESEARNVCVDACISEQIKALWDHGIWTKGCCCGHGEKPPNVIIDQSENPQKARDLLLKEDPKRNWQVLQWQLIDTWTGNSFRT